MYVLPAQPCRNKTSFDIMQQNVHAPNFYARSAKEKQPKQEKCVSHGSQCYLDGYQAVSVRRQIVSQYSVPEIMEQTRSDLFRCVPMANPNYHLKMICGEDGILPE